MARQSCQRAVAARRYRESSDADVEGLWAGVTAAGRATGLQFELFANATATDPLRRGAKTDTT